jgi:hypothetical protein
MGRAGIRRPRLLKVPRVLLATLDLLALSRRPRPKVRGLAEIGKQGVPSPVSGHTTLRAPRPVGWVEAQATTDLNRNLVTSLLTSGAQTSDAAPGPRPTRVAAERLRDRLDRQRLQRRGEPVPPNGQPPRAGTGLGRGAHQPCGESGAPPLLRSPMSRYRLDQACALPMPVLERAGVFDPEWGDRAWRCVWRSGATLVSSLRARWQVDSEGPAVFGLT